MDLKYAQTTRYTLYLRDKEGKREWARVKKNGNWFKEH